MAQLTIYLDEKTRSEIEAAARQPGLSVSRWVRKTLQTALDDQWPEGWFDNLGSLAEVDDFVEPPELSFGADSAREPL